MTNVVVPLAAAVPGAGRRAGTVPGMADPAASMSPHWVPRTEAAVREAAEGGLLDEGHYLDVKREVPSGPRGNRELARDLASFAVDGGLLLIGVDEQGESDQPAGALRLYPVALGGLAERVEQVARSRCDPPLQVRCLPIPASPEAVQAAHGPDVAPAGYGYLIVSVPPSAQAPHMVDGRYYGRGDRAKHTLSDPDVERLHQRRQQHDRDMLALLDEAMADDPIPADRRGHGHLFVLAEPVPGREGLLFAAVPAARSGPPPGTPGWDGGLGRLLSEATEQDAAAAQPLIRNLLIPSFHSGYQQRPDGIAATVGLDATRAFHPGPYAHEVRACELVVRENGGVRVFSGGGTDWYSLPEGPQVVFEGVVLGWARLVVAVAAALGERGGYLGGWAFAVGVTGLRGTLSAARADASLDPLPYGADVYRQATRASGVEAHQARGAITTRLLGRLLRGLGTPPDEYADALTDPTGDTAAS